MAWVMDDALSGINADSFAIKRLSLRKSDGGHLGTVFSEGVKGAAAQGEGSGGGGGTADAAKK